jgi:exopolyphosphatase/guanosine-5'-triphosphate,3'-diphosphate pyrophosphatase
MHSCHDLAPYLMLIVETNSDQTYKIIYNNKLPVKLGKSGIDKKEIRPDAITRGLNAIERHLQTIRELNAEKVYAYATSAVRSARNGEQFVKIIRQRFDLMWVIRGIVKRTHLF